MRRQSVFTGLGVLVSLSLVLGLSLLRPTSGSDQPVADPRGAAQQTPSVASAPSVGRSSEPVQVPVAPCVPAHDRTQPMVIRAEPSVKSGVVATVAGTDSGLVRLDTRTMRGDGDWIQVRYDGRVGWADGALVTCRFTPVQAKQVIAGEVEEVLNALKARNMPALSKHVHPVKGLRFSPSVDIDPKRSVVLMAAQLPTSLEDAKPRRWGSEDGSGEPISSSFADYYKRFMYDRDFASAPEKRFNEFGTKSTTRPNIWQVYPNAIVVEAHVPGTRPESEGMDWSSLLLVFEQHDSRWYLSALVHDQWMV